MKKLPTIKPFVLFRTDSGNYYGFNLHSQRFVFMTHLIFHLVKLKISGNNISKMLENNNISFVVDKQEYDRIDVEYAIKHISFLQKSGLFNDAVFSKTISGRLSPKDVYSTLISTKHIAFEVTEKCNLICKYCVYGEYYNHFDNRNNKSLSIEKGKRFMDFIFDLWSNKSSFSLEQKKTISFYGGEPLLNFSFIHTLVDYINNLSLIHNIKIQYNISTNATFLDKYIDFLKENNFRIMISLDGDSYSNQYRLFPNGESSFNTVYDNTISIMNQYPKYFKDNISFNSVFHHKSDDDSNSENKKVLL